MVRLWLAAASRLHPRNISTSLPAFRQATSQADLAPRLSSRPGRSLWMAHTAPKGSPRTSVEEFQDLLGNLVAGQGRVLALCGAGLSASSGLLTFRGKGGMWRNHRSTDLATPEAFEANPGLVWLFYAWRRHRALSVQPNAAHYALARLARRLTPGLEATSGATAADSAADSAAASATATATSTATAAAEPKTRFLCLTQNVDGLSQRAGHPEASLRAVHGRLFGLMCFDGCGYVEDSNMADPLCPALAPSSVDPDPDWIVDGTLPAPEVDAADLPACPSCKQSLLRPDVVWFGEPLSDSVLEEADDFVCSGKPPVELMLVVGTAATVHPAAGYIELARKHGAVVAVINPDPGAGRGLGSGDFFFQEDAAQILPRLVEKVAGED